MLVELPAPLRRLARVEGEVRLMAERPTLAGLLDALEERYPVLRGTIREQDTGARRPFLRFFAGGEDISHVEPDALLPAAVADGTEALLVIAAIAGGCD